MVEAVSKKELMLQGREDSFDYRKYRRLNSATTERKTVHLSHPLLLDVEQENNAIASEEDMHIPASVTVVPNRHTDSERGKKLSDSLCSTYRGDHHKKRPKSVSLSTLQTAGKF